MNVAACLRTLDNLVITLAYLHCESEVHLKRRRTFAATPGQRNGISDLVSSFDSCSLATPHRTQQPLSFTFTQYSELQSLVVPFDLTLTLNHDPQCSIGYAPSSLHLSSSLTPDQLYPPLSLLTQT